MERVQRPLNQEKMIYVNINWFIHFNKQPSIKAKVPKLNQKLHTGKWVSD